MISQPLRTLADARDHRLQHGLLQVVEQVMSAIEASAASAPWRDLVTLAPGFAEDAARFALGELMRLSPGGST